MVGDEIEFWTRTLADITRCPDCHGRGKREYAVFTEIVIKTEAYADVINEMSADYVPPKRVFRKCETCGGSGHA